MKSELHVTYRNGINLFVHIFLQSLVIVVLVKVVYNVLIPCDHVIKGHVTPMVARNFILPTKFDLHVLFKTLT